MRKQLELCGLVFVVTLAVVGTAGATASGDTAEGGIFRVSLTHLDFVDPALSGSIQGEAVLNPTCARLMAYPDKPPPEGFRLVPEVAVGYPKVSHNGKTYTFLLRTGFRFSDGTPVHASAFARAINRTLAPGIRSGGTTYALDIAGAADVQAGRTKAASGVVARGDKLVIRLTRPVPDFPARLTIPAFCAVPSNLPSDPEGVRTFPAAGPYYVADYRPGERVTLRRNRYYGGDRPHHVDGFDVDLRARSQSEILDRVESGETDWGIAFPDAYFEPGRRLAEKYGVNRTQFFVEPGLIFNQITFNTSRPLFGDNPRLRRAVNFALDRRALGRVSGLTDRGMRLTDQYLPPSIPEFSDARIYPLERADLGRARRLARGSTRGGKAVFLVANAPPPVSTAQAVRRQLEAIGLDVEIVAVPPPALGARLAENGWDLFLGLWAPDVADPYRYLNLLLERRYWQGSNLGHFYAPTYDRLMREAGRLQGAARYRRYAQLDVRLARDVAPLAAIGFFNEATLVSKRVGCVVLRPRLDLTAVCLR